MLRISGESATTSYEAAHNHGRWVDFWSDDDDDFDAVNYVFDNDGSIYHDHGDDNPTRARYRFDIDNL